MVKLVLSVFHESHKYVWMMGNSLLITNHDLTYGLLNAIKCKYGNALGNIESIMLTLCVFVE